jgi:YhcH/YjgK/YiaL family protein
MIVDKLKNASQYSGLSPRLCSGLEYLQQTNFSDVTPGRYELDGANLYALVQEYNTKPLDQGKVEAHRKYIDIQYMVQGVERMGYGDISDLDVSVPYDDSKDAMFLTGDCDFFIMRAGTFMVFFPQDGHMPGIIHGGSQPVKKVVVKVRID